MGALVMPVSVPVQQWLQVNMAAFEQLFTAIDLIPMEASLLRGDIEVRGFDANIDGLQAERRGVVDACVVLEMARPIPHDGLDADLGVALGHFAAACSTVDLAREFPAEWIAAQAGLEAYTAHLSRLLA